MCEGMAPAAMDSPSWLLLPSAPRKCPGTQGGWQTERQIGVGIPCLGEDRLSPWRLGTPSPHVSEFDCPGSSVVARLQLWASAVSALASGLSPAPHHLPCTACPAPPAPHRLPVPARRLSLPPLPAPHRVLPAQRTEWPFPRTPCPLLVPPFAPCPCCPHLPGTFTTSCSSFGTWCHRRASRGVPWPPLPGDIGGLSSAARLLEPVPPRGSGRSAP